MRRSQLASKLMLTGAILAAAYLLQSFFATIILAGVTVIIFNPIYRRLHRRLGHTGPATALTVLIAVLIGVVPTILLLVASYFQALTFFNHLKTSVNLSDPASVSLTVDGLVRASNHLTAGLPGGSSLHLSTSQVTHWVRQAGPAVASGALNFLRRNGGSAIAFFANLVMYFVLISYMFSHQTNILGWLRRISPFQDKINSRYFTRVSAVGRSMVLGTFVVAIAQGVLGACFLAIAGIGYPVFWAIILTLLSIVPLGGGIIAIPIGFVQIATGHIWQGVFILATHFLIINNVDNVLRPILVSRDAALPPVLTLLSAIAGLRLFGPFGVLFGPILMVIIVTTFEMYDEHGEGGMPLKNVKPAKVRL